MKRSCLALLAPLLLSAPALGQGVARLYSVRLTDSQLTYRLKHKLHEVVGTARPTEGRARILPDGTLQVAVRANVADFDSGNANRDANMKEATEANKYPTVEFRGLATGLKVPDSFPTRVPVVLRGKLTFHGVERGVEVPMEVLFRSAREVSAEGRFTISLESYEVERPSLLLVRVEDTLVMEMKFLLQGEEGQ
jgi:polyisoprenoid-binding protein YceI